MTGPKTRICRASAEDIWIRERSLTRELIGHVSFAEMILILLGRDPTPGEVRMLDACLVTLAEHGLTPTAVTARMTYSSAPESVQGAVAAGLASVGSLFVGTMEGCARVLADIVAAPEPERDATATTIVATFADTGRRLPGFGHPLHKPDDPRTPRLLEIARETGVAGPYVDALERLSRAVDAHRGRPLTVNATGTIAATLADAGT